MAQSVVAIHSLLGAEQAAVVEIGGDHFKGETAQEAMGFFHENHRQGVGLLPGGTASAPDAQMLIGNLFLGSGEGWQDQTLQGGELRLGAEEAGSPMVISFSSRCISVVREAERVSSS